MARIRSVKPELRTDLTVAEWPREVRYAWVLLIGYLDDYGRGRDDPRLIVADLFPLDRDVTERKIGLWLDRMAKSGPICRYEVDGEPFLHAVNWSRHQRISHPSDSRIPPCPIHEPYRNGSGAAPESTRNGSGTETESLRASRTRAEQGAGSLEQGTREQGGAADPKPPDRFEEFWNAYPKHVGKQAAQRRWDTLIKRGVDPAEIIAGAKAYAAQMRGTEPQFVKQPDGWLNAGRWEDEPPPKRPKERDPGWQYGMGD